MTTQWITIAITSLAYLGAGLLAWGRLTSKLEAISKAQDKLISTDGLRAAIAEMKTDLYDRIESKIDRAMGKGQNQ